MDIDNLVKNFKQLWKSGRSAHLDLESHAGETWMGLRVRLGHVDQHHHELQPQRQTRNGPSRQRRRMRRAAARENAAAAEKVASNESEAVSKAAKAEANNIESKIEIAAKVTDVVCSDSEYHENETRSDLEVKSGKETEIHEFECWDPRNKWEEQDVVDHMGEALEQMFIVFKVDIEDQQYQLDIKEKSKENFPFTIEIIKSKHSKAMIDNFRRQGYVKGGGCVKFFKKML